MNAGVSGVGEDLNFDMPRGAQIFFEQHAIVAESSHRLSFGAGELSDEIGAAHDDFHAFAAAARRRFQQCRIADRVGLGGKPRKRLVLAMIAGNQRNPGLAHQRLGAGFVAHRPDRRGRRPNEDQTSRSAGPRRSQRSRTGTRSPDAPPLPRVRSAASMILSPATVSFRGAAAGPIKIASSASATCSAARSAYGIDRCGRNAKPPRGPNDAAGDFAAIGDQDFGEHHCPGASHAEDGRTASLRSAR